MQKEAFTIQKEALSDFTVIGKGVCVCACMSICVHFYTSVTYVAYVPLFDAYIVFYSRLNM